jgi:phosphopantothenoylcysteine decarboxylase/phosphopantothenate--cysteine ligase
MNDNMYKNRIVQENIAKLKDCGYKFVGPVKGNLACGYEAIGHIAEPEAIVKEILSLI